MPGNSKVTAALGHWVPRLVANGVPLTDFQEVTAEIESWDDWCAEWSKRAAVHEEMGRLALDGGYYAPRAAAHRPRLKACVSLSGPFDWAEAWETLPDLTRAAFVARSYSATHAEARIKAGELTLRVVVHNVECPLFVVAGKQDRVIPWDHARRIAEGASGPVTFLPLENAVHVAINRTYRYRLQSADWMADILYR